MLKKKNRQTIKNKDSGLIELAFYWEDTHEVSINIRI